MLKSEYEREQERLYKEAECLAENLTSMAYTFEKRTEAHSLSPTSTSVLSVSLNDVSSTWPTLNRFGFVHTDHYGSRMIAAIGTARMMLLQTLMYAQKLGRDNCIHVREQIAFLEQTQESLHELFIKPASDDQQAKALEIVMKAQMQILMHHRHFLDLLPDGLDGLQTALMIAQSQSHLIKDDFIPQTSHLSFSTEDFDQGDERYYQHFQTFLSLQDPKETFAYAPQERFHAMRYALHKNFGVLVSRPVLFSEQPKRWMANKVKTIFTFLSSLPQWLARYGISLQVIDRGLEDTSRALNSDNENMVHALVQDVRQQMYNPQLRPLPATAQTWIGRLHSGLQFVFQEIFADMQKHGPIGLFNSLATALFFAGFSFTTMVRLGFNTLREGSFYLGPLQTLQQKTSAIAAFHNTDNVELTPSQLAFQQVLRKLILAAEKEAVQGKIDEDMLKQFIDSVMQDPKCMQALRPYHQRHFSLWSLIFTILPVLHAPIMILASLAHTLATVGQALLQADRQLLEKNIPKIWTFCKESLRRHASSYLWFWPGLTRPCLFFLKHIFRKSSDAERAQMVQAVRHKVMTWGIELYTMVIQTSVNLVMLYGLSLFFAPITSVLEWLIARPLQSLGSLFKDSAERLAPDSWLLVSIRILLTSFATVSHALSWGAHRAQMSIRYGTSFCLSFCQKTIQEHVDTLQKFNPHNNTEEIQKHLLKHAEGCGLHLDSEALDDMRQAAPVLINSDLNTPHTPKTAAETAAAEETASWRTTKRF